jgi:hypothetical protein
LVDIKILELRQTAENATWRSWRLWQTLGEAGNWKITNWLCLKIGYIPNEIAIW